MSPKLAAFLSGYLKEADAAPQPLEVAQTTQPVPGKPSDVKVNTKPAVQPAAAPKSPVSPVPANKMSPRLQSQIQSYKKIVKDPTFERGAPQVGQAVASVRG